MAVASEDPGTAARCGAAAKKVRLRDAEMRARDELRAHCDDNARTAPLRGLGDGDGPADGDGCGAGRPGKAPARSSRQDCDRCYSCDDSGVHQCAQCVRPCCARHCDVTIARRAQCKENKARERTEAEGEGEKEREEWRHRRVLAALEQIGQAQRSAAVREAEKVA